MAGILNKEDKRAPFETMEVEKLREELTLLRDRKKELYQTLKPLLDEWNEVKEQLHIGEDIYRGRVRDEAVRNGKVVIIPKSCKNPVRFREKKAAVDPLLEDMVAAVGRGDFKEVARLQAEILAIK